jgi:4-hydroxybenzoate polyprenyltransferase
MVSPAQNFSLGGFLKLTRFSNLLIILLAEYFTVFFLIASPEDWQTYLLSEKLFLLVLSTLIIAASGYIINDYYDVKIDYINKPHRVVVGKVIKRRIVMVSHTVLNLTGIAIGYLVSPTIAIINFGCALLLWLYSNQLKRLPLIGNIAVAILTGLSIYILEIVYHTDNSFILIYTVFAIGFTLIREIVKDLEDMKGDATFGCRTLPVVIGIRKTKIVVIIVALLFVSIINVLIYQTSAFQHFWLITGNILAIVFILFLLNRADTVKQFHQLSTWTKVMMIIGVLSMAIV